MKKIIISAFLVAISFLVSAPRLAEAVKPSDFGLKEGDVISATDDPDVYIINENGFKRLFVNPEIFNLYGHLGWDKIKKVSPETRDVFITSGLFRNCESADQKVYGLDVVNEDIANLRWVNSSGAKAVADDADFFKKVFCINNKETKLYGVGSQYSSVRDIPKYERKGSTVESTPSPSIATDMSISSITPNKILNTSAIDISIRGIGFKNGARVNIGTGGDLPLVTFVSENQLNVRIPGSLPALTYNLSVTNPDGKVVSKVDALTIQVPPPVVKNGLTTSEVFNLVSPSVVKIICGGGSGSGFVFESSGYILTNEHVARHCGTTATIKLKDNTVLTGNVLGKDAINDVAVIKVNQSLPSLVLGDSDEQALPLGSNIFVLGHPLGLNNIVITQGLLTSRQRDSNLGFDYLTTDAATEPGSSGGPWVNGQGEVIGLHEAALNSVKLSIPISFTKTIIPKLKTGVSTVATPTPSSTPSPTPIATPTPTPTPITPGNIFVTEDDSSPSRQKNSLYWGQTGAAVSSFKVRAINEGFYINKFSLTSADIDDAKANVNNIYLEYKDKNGSTLVSTKQSLNSNALVSFTFTSDSRPYIPKDQSRQITVKIDTTNSHSSGATSGVDFAINFSGASSNEFDAIGENSLTKIGGNDTTNNDTDNIAVTNKSIIYRSFPKFTNIVLSDGATTPNAVVGKFTITAMGYDVLFSTAGADFGSIIFDTVASGQATQADPTFTLYDDATGEIMDSATYDIDTVNASLSFNSFSNALNIPGGSSKTLRVQGDLSGFNRQGSSTAGTAADHFMLLLQDEAGVIKWVDSAGADANLSQSNTTGYIKNLPFNGPNMVGQ